MWQYSNPVSIHWTTDLGAQLPALAVPGRGLLFVYSQSFLTTAGAGSLAGHFAGIPVFTVMDSNPSLALVQRAIDFVRQHKPSWIVAIGGGSVMDTAKAARLAMACGSGRIEDLLDSVPRILNRPFPQLIVVPTTHGTGAEVTPWATIWDKESGRKHSLAHPGNYPDFAVLCPSLTRTLPLAASLSSSLDALAHALEALWNRNDNPVSDEFALAAIRLVCENLELLDGEVPAAARENLLRASLFAGLAFSNTRTAAAHSISYPLTLRFGIPHGIACSLPLFSLWPINAPHMPEKAERLRRFLDGEDVGKVLERLRRFVAARIPYSLSEYGAGPADLDSLAAASFTKGRMENNRVALDLAAVHVILEDMLHPCRPGE